MQVYRAIKYIRLSYTDDKSTESDSVANQRKLIDNYIVQHPEIEVVDEKIDDGYSGVLFDRPAFPRISQLKFVLHVDPPPARSAELPVITQLYSVPYVDPPEL